MLFSKDQTEITHWVMILDPSCFGSSRLFYTESYRRTGSFMASCMEKQDRIPHRYWGRLPMATEQQRNLLTLSISYVTQDLILFYWFVRLFNTPGSHHFNCWGFNIWEDKLLSVVFLFQSFSCYFWMFIFPYEFELSNYMFPLNGLLTIDLINLWRTDIFNGEAPAQEQGILFHLLKSAFVSGRRSAMCLMICFSS